MAMLFAAPVVVAQAAREKSPERLSTLPIWMWSAFVPPRERAISGRSDQALARQEDETEQQGFLGRRGVAGEGRGARLERAHERRLIGGDPRVRGDGGGV